MWKPYSLLHGIALCFVISSGLSCSGVDDEGEKSVRGDGAVHTKSAAPAKSTPVAPAPKKTQHSQAVTKKQPGSTSKSVLKLPQLIDRVEPAVVRLDVTSKDKKWLGSGFVVAPGDVVVTNYHVVSGAAKIVATFSDKTTAPVIGAMYVDAKRDLAVVKLKLKTPRSTVLTLRKSMPKKGESVMAFGAPHGLSFSATEGIVSGLRTAEELKSFGLSVAGRWIQTSAPISPGNSGGPLVDLHGRVVGVNTLRHRSGQNLNFAVSAIEVNPAVLIALGNSPGDFPKKSAGDAVASGDSGATREALSPQAKRYKENLERQIATRRKEIESLKQAYAADIKRLKESLLAGDDELSAATRKEIAKTIQKMKSVIELDFSVPEINLVGPRKGEVGIVAFPNVVRVFQILDKSSGTFLAETMRVRGSKRIVLLRNLNISNFVEKQRATISRKLVLEVLGTYTYRNRLGTTNTVYQLTSHDNLDDRKKTLRKLLPSGNGEPVLSDEEKKIVARHLAARAKKQASLNLDELLKKRQATASRLLKYAKQFKKDGKPTIARRRFEEIVKKYPESPAAKEAAMETGISAEDFKKAKALKEEALKKLAASTKPAAVRIAEQNERTAAKKLESIRSIVFSTKFRRRGVRASSIKSLRAIIKSYPDTKAAKRAEKLLQRILDL